MRAQAGVVRKAAQIALQAAKTARDAAIRVARDIARATAATSQGVFVLVGGGALLLILLISVMAVAVILSSPFGVFHADDNPDNQPLSATVAALNEEVLSEMKGIALSSGADKVVLDCEGDGGPVTNWPEVLAVFSVKTASDTPDGMDVVTMDEERIDRLRQVLRDMNEITQRTRIEQSKDAIAADSGDSSTARTINVLYVGVRSKTADQQAAEYGFTPGQLDTLHEMLSGEYRSMLYAMLGVDALPGLTPVEIEALFRDLPPGELGNEIVRFALDQLGTLYSEKDCSAFTRYCYAHAGITLPRTAAEQAKYCVDNGFVIAPEDILPGDLVFFHFESNVGNGRFMEIGHVGIFAGEGMIIDSSSTRGEAVYRKLYSGQVLWGRPHIGMEQPNAN